MKTLLPVTDEHTVPEPRDTEFEVQATLYVALKSLGFDVRGEVTWRNKKTREVCRFDLVLYEHGIAAHIIECKAAPMVHKNGLEATRQGRRYRQFGVPVTFVYGLADAKEFVQSQLHTMQ